MAKLTRYVPKERPELADNIYTAKIIKVETKVWAPDNISLSWTFELTQPPYLGQKVWVYGSTGSAPTPKAKLTAWGAILGYSIEQLRADDFDTNVFVGAYVKVFLKTWTKESGGEKQGVTDILELTEADQQLLDLWLKDLKLAGTTRVAAAASQAAAPAHSAFPPLQQAAPAPAPVVAQPAPVVAQPAPVAAPEPVATAPAAVPAPVAAPRKRNDLPF